MIDSYEEAIKKYASVNLKILKYLNFPGGSDGKEICNAGDLVSVPGLGRFPWRARQPTPVSLFGELHGQRSLGSYSPWGSRVGHEWWTNTHILTLSIFLRMLVLRPSHQNTWSLVFLPCLKVNEFLEVCHEWTKICTLGTKWYLNERRHVWTHSCPY